MMFLRELKKGSTKILILTLLEKKPMYGYEIIKEIKNRSKNYFNISEGTLYPALHSLERNSLVKSRWHKFKGRERKYYYLTKKGLKFAQKASKEWNLFVRNLAVFLAIK